MKNVFIGGGAIAVALSIIGGLADVGKATRNIDRVSTISDSSRVIDTVNDTGEINSTANKAQQVIEPIQKTADVYSTADSLSKFENSNSCNKDSNQQPTNQEC
ncbi:Chemotaxis protein [Vibrio crassostreae]|uniref:hypothetical protein n=1 Tax=Vibrio crassostreae TaxID=246167 RepID=UPI001B30211C|nr:hypothetical protein [Vibrio crassostreae]CAK1994527.1 Chemotaxis protein [Vibrio crassostreae]CAK2920235.1 Chemotaxis protein [Vibrio crassostreae]CAK3677855.1 Chemotaxis protein [Vibrio crassostreae]